MSYLSVSTWSLHRLLGPLRLTVWDAESGSQLTRVQEQPQLLTLLELPGKAAARGYRAVEVCHFHFPSTESAYLEELRQAFRTAGVSLDTLLLDYGDLTSADEQRRVADLAFIRKWIGIASSCGAKQIRVVAGEAQPDDKAAIAISAAALAELAEYAAEFGVRVITENFKPLASTGESSLQLLAQAGSRVGFITDFGNYHGERKLAEIASTTPYSVSIHAKPTYDEAGYPDREQLIAYLDQVRQAGFDGAYVLIYDGPGDMWEGLERVKAIVEPYVLTAR
ncbi:sugar phosphate isomerase/epimerase family protein [Paenibacillus arenilitoris]|uniref:Sugar phosphate isomerase/epimerase n=1 Tax=Paenibacillus arenilitoris TaxID=2772299 RepID=A0A927H5R2_9BACL|nr:TIM barrel protein [Paenibacillus arenilitoris]MBD2869731.1 sugar phosphate isomerase/epimerase [Paenibacillus arenilitoris]